MIVKQRTTQSDWQAVAEENPIARVLATAERWVEQVCSGLRPVAYLCGPPGVGKSWAIRKGVDASRRKPLRSNPSNYRALLRDFERSEGRRAIIIEEADQIWRSERMINILKIATDEGGSRVVEEEVRASERGVPVASRRTINMTAPLLVATNTAINDLRVIQSKLRPHVQALLDRSPPLVIPSDRYDLWEYACFLAIIHDAIRYDPKHDPLSVRLQNHALRWFTEHLQELSLVSPRRLREIAWAMARYWDRRADDWIAGGEAMFLADMAPTLIVRSSDPQMPHLIAPTLLVPERRPTLVLPVTHLAGPDFNEALNVEAGPDESYDSIMAALRADHEQKRLQRYAKVAERRRLRRIEPRTGTGEAGPT